MREKLKSVVAMNDGKSAFCDGNNEVELFTSGVAGRDVSAVILAARDGRKFGGLVHFATDAGEEHAGKLKEILATAAGCAWDLKRLQVFVARNDWEQEETTARLGLLIQAVKTQLGDDVRVDISTYLMTHVDGISRGGHGEISLRVSSGAGQSISLCWKDGSGM